jgi:hypothetical protein
VFQHSRLIDDGDVVSHTRLSPQGKISGNEKELLNVTLPFFKMIVAFIYLLILMVILLI